MINLGNDHQMAANFMKKETTRYMPLGWNTPIRYSYQKEKLKSDRSKIASPNTQYGSYMPSTDWPSERVFTD